MQNSVKLFGFVWLISQIIYGSNGLPAELSTPQRETRELWNCATSPSSSLLSLLKNLHKNCEVSKVFFEFVNLLLKSPYCIHQSSFEFVDRKLISNSKSKLRQFPQAKPISVLFFHLFSSFPSRHIRTFDQVFDVMKVNIKILQITFTPNSVSFVFLLPHHRFCVCMLGESYLEAKIFRLHSFLI